MVRLLLDRGSQIDAKTRVSVRIEQQKIKQPWKRYGFLLHIPIILELKRAVIISINEPLSRFISEHKFEKNKNNRLTHAVALCGAAAARQGCWFRKSKQFGVLLIFNRGKWFVFSRPLRWYDLFLRVCAAGWSHSAPLCCSQWTRPSCRAAAGKRSAPTGQDQGVYFVLFSYFLLHKLCFLAVFNPIYGHKRAPSTWLRHS